MPSFFSLKMRMRQGYVLAPPLLNRCMEWVLCRVVRQSYCGSPVGNTEITDLVFVDDAIIPAESLDILVMVLDTLKEWDSTGMILCEIRDCLVRLFQAD